MGLWKAFAKPYKNINRIFPTKQKDVGEMVKVCKKDDNIRKIIVFGSSVTPLCNPWSDIDIYFEMKTGSRAAVFDRWDNFSVDDDLMHEIATKGVVVYER